MIKDPRFNFEEQERQVTGARIAAGTVIAGGATFGTFKSRHKLAQALRYTPDIATQTAGQLKTLGRYAGVRPFNVVAPAAGDLSTTGASITGTRLNLLSAMEASGGIKIPRRDIAQSAYEALLSSGNVTGANAYASYQQIMSSASVSEAYNLARSAIQQQQGSADLFVRRLQETIGGGVYDPTRLYSISQAQTIGGQFAANKGGTRLQSNLSPILQRRAQRIQMQLEEAAGQAGATAGNWEYYNIEDVVGGKKVSTPLLRGKVAGVQVTIPLQHTGLTYGGKSLTSRYVTRSAYDPAGTGYKTYGQNYVDQLKTALSQQKNIRDAKEAVHRVNLDLIQNMKERDSASKAAAVWSLPEPMMTSGGRAKARMTLFQAVSTRGDLTQQEAREIYAKTVGGGRQLWPLGSPEAVAKGTLMTKNIREGLYGPLGKWFPIERRPDQFIRSEWGVSEQAKQAASPFAGRFGKSWDRVDRKIKGSMYEQLLYGGAGARSGAAYSTPQMIALYTRPGITGMYPGLPSEEQGLLSLTAAESLEYQRVKQKTISLAPGFKAHEQLLDLAEGRVGDLVEFETPIKPFAAKGIPGVSEGRMVDPYIGVEQKTGKELFVGAGEEIIGAERIGPEEARIYVRETKKLGPGQYGKFYAEEVKHMMGVARTQEKFAQMVQKVGGGFAAAATGQQAEAVLAGAILEKNPYARAMQQIEALSIMAGRQIDSGVLKENGRLVAEALLDNPQAYLNVTKTMSEEQLARNMVSAARTMELSTAQKMLTFGAMPQKIAEKVLTPQELSFVKAPGVPVIGVSGMRLGQIGGEYASRGALDPAGFNLLAMQGPAGQEAAADLARRVVGKGQLQAVDRMMASVLGIGDPTRTITDVAKDVLGTREAVPISGFVGPTGEGTWVDLGRKYKEFGGSSKIYIPGQTEMPDMFKPIISATGEEVMSPMAREFEQFKRTVLTPGTTEEAQEAAAAAFRKATQVEWARESAQGGKILGARSLQAIADETLEAGVYGISEKEGRLMFDEMLEQAIDADEAKFLREQKKALLSGEQAISGYMWRHPSIGPESVQPIRFQVDRNLSDGMVSVPKQFGKIQFGNADPRIVDISAAIGSKYDFDGDHLIVSAIGSKRAQQSMLGKAGHQRAADYTEYLFNHYAMKGLMDERKVKENITAMTELETLISGSEKATAAKIRTGQINVALGKFKSAVATAAPEQYRPLAGVFEMMEQSIAVGGKHGAAGAEAFEKIAMAAQSRDPRLLQESFEAMMGTEPFEVAGEFGGRKMRWAYEPKKWSEVAMDALDAVHEDVDAAMKIRGIAKNRGMSNDLQDAVRLFNVRRSSVDIAQALRHAEAYGSEGFAGVGNRLLRQGEMKARRLSAIARKGSKPMIAAAAIGAGLLMAAPSISGVLRSSSNTEGPSGGQNAAYEGPMMTGEGMNVPPARIMESPKVYDIPGGNPSSYANINFRTSDLDSSRRDIMKQAGALSSGAKVRVNIKDNRNKLDSHMLAQKIHERL